ncbi:MAG: hypothetical protein WC852_05035 [Candidatus Nanoarchaeia archaeon]|jgi:hypothetical protein
MVHKRYVKRGNKVYGPYLYNSKRVGNKVVNEYLGIDKTGEWKKAGLMVSFFVLLLLGIVYAEYGIMSGTTSGTTSNLTIWDQGLGGIDNSSWFSNCSSYTYTHCDSGKSASDAIVLFYANYSNSTVGPIIGNCSIRFNYTGSYGPFSDMNYNPLTFLYEFNSSFNIRSNYSTQFMIQINCSNISSDSNIRYDNLSTVDYFEIKNTIPYNILPYAYASTTPIQTCNEDTACTYNVSTNFTDDDDNDLPLSSFNINSTSSTFSTCTLSVSDLGIITALCTNSSQSGSYNAFVTARDGAGSSSASLTIPYIIIAVNDKPIITASTLTKSCTEGMNCSFNISVWDEESGAITNGIGAIGNFTFTDNSSMFNINSTTGNISFIPTNAQVGTHRIEINITDPNGDTNSSILTLTIANFNDPPTLFYACNTTNNTILQEDVVFSCMLNASDQDPDGTDSHTYMANYSWFTINCNNVPINGGNTICNVTFAPTDIAVFSHWINITVNDSGGLSSSRIINFSVDNTPDFPRWTNISTNYTAWANVSYWTQVTATDDDSLTIFGENVTYSANYTWFSINVTTGVISFNNTALNGNVGTYWINITANDTTDRQNSTVINFTIYANSYPALIITQEYNMTEGYSFYLNISANVTTDEGETLAYADNTSLFSINSTTGEINFTPTDNKVGTHWISINITDSHNTINQSIFNFTVYNEEDAPILGPIYNITNGSEGTAITFQVNATDADLSIPNTPEYLRLWSNSSYLFTINASSGVISGNITRWTITFTPGASSNGTYWFNFTVNDTSDSAMSRIFFINISEGNVAPAFLDTDPSFCATRTAAEDTLFTSCTLIACDNDTGTTLAFNANYSWFNMSHSAITATEISANNYCANVTVNFTPLYTEVGNWSILLNVTDHIGASDTYEISFNISSVNDAPNLTTIADLTAIFEIIFTYDINATDEENDTLTFSKNASYNWLSLNSSTGVITIDHTSPLDEGTYRVNFTVNDTWGAMDSQVVNITLRSDTAPYCTVISNTYLAPIISFDPRTEVANFTLRESEITGNFTAQCDDDEDDMITFDWYWNVSLNRTHISSSGTGTQSDSWGYRTNYLNAGNYTMKLVVIDPSLENSTYNITVSVTNINAPPGLIANIPTIEKLPDGTSWDNSDGPNSRDMTSYFYDIDNDNLTYSWYRYALNESFNDNNFTRINETWLFSGTWFLQNGSTNNPAIRQNDTTATYYSNISLLTYTNLTEFSAIIKLMGSGSAGLCFASLGSCETDAQIAYFNSADNKTYLQKYDSGILSYSNNSYLFNVTLNTSYWIKANVKANTTLVYSSSNGTDWSLVYNVTFNETATGNAKLLSISSDAIFDNVTIKDPDLRNMTLKDEGGNNISFTPTSGWHGDMPIVITAADGINATDSNEFNLHIEEVTVLPPVTVTTTTSSSSTVMQTQIADMTILVPSMISLTPLSKTIVPVILKNTGQIDLNTITLVATSNQTELRLKLNETKWTAIKVGNSVYVNLDVDIGLLAPDRYTIRLDAESQVPPLKRFVEIVVDVREKDAVLKAQLKEMIQFTRDLFLQNPECLELTELIEEAEAKFRVYQYEEGLEMIHRANQGCKEFIAAKKGESDVRLSDTAKNFIQQHWKTIILEGIGLILAVLLLVYYFQRRSATRL